MARKTEAHKVQKLIARKNNLEARLEHLKYHKLMKTISANSKLSITQKGEFTKKPTSIYEENPTDPKMSIRSNLYFYDNLIKDAFNVSDSSDSEEDIKETGLNTNKKAYEKALQRFMSRNKDMSQHPKQISDRRMKTLAAED